MVKKIQGRILNYLRTSLRLGAVGCVLYPSGALASTSEKVSAAPYVLFYLWDRFPVTNSMVTSWVFSILLIIVIRLAVGKKPALIPSRSQAVVEGTFESIQNILEPIVGKTMVKPTFPLLLGFFLYILIQNWSGLIPGIGAFGRLETGNHLLYYFRPSNADLNSTLALAIVSFVAWLYYVFRYAGARSLFFELFGNKADPKEVPVWLYIPLFFVFFAVGLVECISIVFRLVSLSFRLFGNEFGGDNLLTNMTNLYSYFLPVPFYFLEILIGAIQAFVFTLLVAVYIGLICNHGGEHEHG